MSIELMTEIRSLLAVIHRDGGHHTEKVGLAQSVKNAQALIIRERAERGARLLPQRFYCSREGCDYHP